MAGARPAAGSATGSTPAPASGAAVPAGTLLFVRFVVLCLRRSIPSAAAAPVGGAAGGAGAGSASASLERAAAQSGRLAAARKVGGAEGCAHMLRVVLCDVITGIATEAQLRQALVDEEVVQLLVELLRRDDDDAVLFSVSKALINLTQNTTRAKQAVIDLGGARLMVEMLRGKHEGITSNIATVLKNCTDTEDHRRAMVRADAFQRLISLLSPEAVEGVPMPDSVLAAAAALLWNLSIDASHRSILTTGAGDPRAAGGAGTGAIQHLVQVIKARAKAGDVIEKCAGALMMLISDENRDVVYERSDQIVTALCQALMSAQEGDLARTVRLTRNIFACLVKFMGNPRAVEEMKHPANARCISAGIGILRQPGVKHDAVVKQLLAELEKL